MKSREYFELKNYFDSLSTDEIVEWYSKKVRKACILFIIVAFAYAIVGYVIGAGGIL